MSSKEKSEKKIENDRGWIRVSELDSVLEKIEVPTPIKTKIEKNLKEIGGHGISLEDLLDNYLEEISRGVFGFSVSDLTAPERQDIQRIKREILKPQA